MRKFTYPNDMRGVLSNRRKFIKALLTEPQDYQCRTELFSVKLGNKCKRCAVGLAADVFFGVKSYDDVMTFNNEDRGEGYDVYSAVSKMLGVGSSAHDREGAQMTVSDIWSLNDDDKMPFATIAESLAHKWGLELAS